MLVAGANGQLGTDLCLDLRDLEVIPLSHDDVEIIDMRSVKEGCKWKWNSQASELYLGKRHM